MIHFIPILFISGASAVFVSILKCTNQEIDHLDNNNTTDNPPRRCKLH